MRSLFRKTELKFVRLCNVYIPRGGGAVLVSATFNHGGLFAEKPEAVVECNIAISEEIGTAVKQKINECEYRPQFKYSGQKKSDWPAFKHSGIKTIKSFEDNYVRYSIKGANDANIIWQIDSPEFHNDIRLESSVSASAEPIEIGEWIKRFHEFFLKVEKVA